MATPMVSDVFKFLAIRPPQPVTEQQATRTFVRDGRATTQAGVQELKRIARKLLQPEAALAAWAQLDLASLNLLADGYQQLTTLYRSLDASADAPTASSQLTKAGVTNVNGKTGPAFLSAAWEALYTAHATGNGAGSLNDRPMAALRLLHFVDVTKTEPRPDRAAALAILNATVVVPTAFNDVFADRPTAPNNRRFRVV